MYLQQGGMLPVYAGTRYQRGGGILSSIASFMLPTAKKLLTETVKAAPGVVDSILNNKQSAGSAILSGLKAAGSNTAKDAFHRVMGSQRSRVAKRRAPANAPAKTKKRRKTGPKDIFT